ncbi:MAG: DUF1684 domain-containing protein [Ferruginibacter sp.]
MKLTLTLFLFFIFSTSFSQTGKDYVNTLKTYQRNYITTHEVVKGNDKKYFRFYPVDEKYKMQCRFEPVSDTTVVVMKTSGKTIPQKNFVRYGKIYFSIHDTAVFLTVYRSKELEKNPQYSRYLFIPFTDITTGDETYGSGRYIDIFTWDIKKGSVEIDFNKAYNPYCAYSTGYNCPIPPRENLLPVAIKAGEKIFAKGMH